MTPSPIDIYRRQIERELQAGNATEHTHRPALKTLIESLAPGLTATNEPKRVECESPDLILSPNVARSSTNPGDTHRPVVTPCLRLTSRDVQWSQWPRK